MGKTFTEYNRLNSSDIAVEGNKVWLVRPSINGLVELNLDTGESDIIYRFDRFFENNWFQSICKIGNEIIMFPSASDEIVVFDLLEKKDYVFQINPPQITPIKYDPELKFWNYCRLNNEIMIFGYTYPTIVHLNLKNKSIDYLDSWVNQIENNLVSRDYNGYFGYGSLIMENKILVPLLCCNGILEINIENMDCCVKFVEGIDCGFRTLKGDLADRCIWLESVNGQIIKMSMDYRIQAQIDIPDRNSSYYWGEFYPPIIMDSCLLFYPMSSKYVYSVDKQAKSMKRVKETDNFFEERWYINLSLFKECEDRVIMVHYGDYKWRIMNRLDDEIIKEICFHPNRETIRNEIMDCFADKGVMEEDQDGLEVLVRALL